MMYSVRPLIEKYINIEPEAYLDIVIEHSYDGIFITDGDANTLTINEAYERITGLSRSEMLNRNMRDLVAEGYISESGSLKAIEAKETISLSQTFRTGKKALITSKPVMDKEGNVIVVVTNVRDITELTEVKDRLEMQERLAEKYLAEADALKKQLLDTSDLIVEDKKMIDVLYTAQKVAMTDFTVMITGESGVGKEVLAKFLHNNSHRSNGNFIKVNCGAIPENLIESELFGYEGGAFTGASAGGKPGLFEIAHGGTIFLDEIGELPYNMQVKLLRVLQEGEFTRVGGISPKKTDIRVVAATHRNLEHMVQSHAFREDLYYRLNVIPILVPPLRERPEDILALIRYFLDGINMKYHWQKRFGRDALDAMHDYYWPGNIRELKNVVERVVAMSRDDVIACDDLPNKIVTANRENVMRYLTDIVPLDEAVIGVEEALLTKAFEKYGNVRGAAKALGIDASTFVRKRQRIQKYRASEKNSKESETNR